MPQWKDAAIAEKFIDFETEVSIVGARSPSGQLAFYELTENFHDDGILQLSIKTEGGFAKYQKQAEEYLRTHGELGLRWRDGDRILCY